MVTRGNTQARKAASVPQVHRHTQHALGSDAGTLVHSHKYGPYLHPKLQVSRKSLSLLPRRRNPSPTIPTMNCSDEETRSLLPLPSPIPTEGSFVPPQKHLSHFQSLPQMFALQHSPPSTQHVAPRTPNSITPPGPLHQTFPLLLFPNSAPNPQPSYLPTLCCLSASL